MATCAAGPTPCPCPCHCPCPCGIPPLGLQAAEWVRLRAATGSGPASSDAVMVPAARLPVMGEGPVGMTQGRHGSGRPGPTGRGAPQAVVTGDLTGAGSPAPSPRVPGDGHTPTVNTQVTLLGASSTPHTRGHPRHQGEPLHQSNHGDTPRDLALPRVGVASTGEVATGGVSGCAGPGRGSRPGVRGRRRWRREPEQSAGSCSVCTEATGDAG